MTGSDCIWKFTISAEKTALGARRNNICHNVGNNRRMEKNLKILVLEDMEDDFELIEYILTEANLKFTTKRVDSREQFVSALRKIT